jgi:predicted small secreted protein
MRAAFDAADATKIPPGMRLRWRQRARGVANIVITSINARACRAAFDDELSLAPRHPTGDRLASSGFAEVDRSPSTLSMERTMKFCIALVCAACALALGGCNTMEGLGTDIAKGGQKIQNASQQVREDWREARARNENAYDQARARCAGLSGTDRDACLDRAHDRYTAEMDTARREYPRGSMAAQSQEDRREDAYDAARNRCESLRGSAEDQCIADARARYR